MGGAFVLCGLPAVSQISAEDRIMANEQKIRYANGSVEEVREPGDRHFDSNQDAIRERVRDQATSVDDILDQSSSLKGATTSLGVGSPEVPSASGGVDASGAGALRKPSSLDGVTTSLGVGSPEGPSASGGVDASGAGAFRKPSSLDGVTTSLGVGSPEAPEVPPPYQGVEVREATLDEYLAAMEKQRAKQGQGLSRRHSVDAALIEEIDARFADSPHVREQLTRAIDARGMAQQALDEGDRKAAKRYLNEHRGVMQDMARLSAFDKGLERFLLDHQDILDQARVTLEHRKPLNEPEVATPEEWERAVRKSDALAEPVSPRTPAPPVGSPAGDVPETSVAPVSSQARDVSSPDVPDEAPTFRGRLGKALGRLGVLGGVGAAALSYSQGVEARDAVVENLPGGTSALSAEKGNYTNAVLAAIDETIVGIAFTEIYRPLSRHFNLHGKGETVDPGMIEEAAVSLWQNGARLVDRVMGGEEGETVAVSGVQQAQQQILESDVPSIPPSRQDGQAASPAPAEDQGQLIGWNGDVPIITMPTSMGAVAQTGEPQETNDPVVAHKQRPPSPTL